MIGSGFGSGNLHSVGTTQTDTVYTPINNNVDGVSWAPLPDSISGLQEDAFSRSAVQIDPYISDPADEVVTTPEGLPLSLAPQSFRHQSDAILSNDVLQNFYTQYGAGQGVIPPESLTAWSQLTPAQQAQIQNQAVSQIDTLAEQNNQPQEPSTGEFSQRDLWPIQIPIRDYGAALGMPEDLYQVFEIQNPLKYFPTGLGDFSFLTTLTANIRMTEIQLQVARLNQIYTILDSVALAPNPNFSYIPGLPPYGSASPNEKRQQEAVFNRIKEQVLFYLQDVQERLNQVYSGIDTLKTWAEGLYRSQNEAVREAVSGR